MYLDLGVFILFIIAGYGFDSFNATDLMRWGANYGPAVKEGEYWRLLSCIFLHNGIVHLVSNLMGLMLIGIFLEPLIGSLRYAICYLITGICASIVSMLWHPESIGVGASGAIFGMYGILLALVLTNLLPKGIRSGLLLPFTWTVGYGLLYGLRKGVDNAAHVGGLCSGFVMGFILYLFMNNELKDVPLVQRCHSLGEIKVCYSSLGKKRVGTK
jgi:rhomboid protease GluP